MHYNVTHVRRQAFYSLPQEHWQTLAAPPVSYLDTLNAVDDAIDVNARITSAILSSALTSFDLQTDRPKASQSDHTIIDWRGAATGNDLEKAQTIIRQFYRDWSVEGGPERDACNGPVLKDLAAEFAAANLDRNKIKVLIPGAGLGRLVFEVCAAGYQAEGNEISYHALLASSWILNYLAPPPLEHDDEHHDQHEQFDLYPWLNQFSNRISRKDQLRCVRIPDVHPGTILDRASRQQQQQQQQEEEGGRRQSIHAFERMSMTASDFTLLYAQPSHQATYDAVCTVFFIDTAPNFLRYLYTIRNCLRSGGVWSNVGPLLWHFGPTNTNHPRHHGHHGDDDDDDDKNNRGNGDDDDNTGNDVGDNDDHHHHVKRLSGTKSDQSVDKGIAEPGSVELTNEDILALISSHGFVIEKHEILEPASQSGRRRRQQQQHQTERDGHDGMNKEMKTDEGSGGGSGDGGAGVRCTGYIHDPTSMYQQLFRLSHWLARKL